jgi:biotin synthase
MVKDIKQRVLAGGHITEYEAVELLSYANKKELYEAANDIRMHFKGAHLEMCSILNARSGRCSEDCKWCSQSIFHKTNIEEYELVDRKEAEHMAKENADKGVHRFSLVTSGRTISNENLDQLCAVYKHIKKTASIHTCASMGLLSREQMLKLKDAGVSNYHCNIETAPSFFPKLVSTHTIEEKIETIKYAQELGLEVCSGGIIGMGETAEQRIEMAFKLKELNITSIPVNLLTPIKGTKLEGMAKLNDDEILTTFALFRFINPTAKIRLAAGRNLIAHMQNEVLAAGANAALVGDYLTTNGSNISQDKEAFKKAGFSLD